MREGIEDLLWHIANYQGRFFDDMEFIEFYLGLIFYNYLSEKIVAEMNKKLIKYEINYTEAFQEKNQETYGEYIKEQSLKELGFFIKPENLFKEIIKNNLDPTFVKKLNEAFKQIIFKNENINEAFQFIDFTSFKVGRNLKEKDDLLIKIIKTVSSLDFSLQNDEDDFGEKFQYLINKFGQSSGKKINQFDTPENISKLLAKLVTTNKKPINNLYDAACGTGSTLLKVKDETEVQNYYGQEVNQATYFISLMNMIINQTPINNIHFYLEDSIIINRKFENKMDAIVSNPPLGLKTHLNKELLNDERYNKFKKLPSKTSATYYFIENMLYHLDTNGTMAVIVERGTLFRHLEKSIRQEIIETYNYLDAVINLPEKMFETTNIATSILIFKKNRKHTNILFIDASKDYQTNRKTNKLNDLTIKKIIKTYTKQKEIDKYSHNATLKEIQKNNYNLNISRYIDTFETKKPINIKEVNQELNNVKKELKKVNQEYEKYLEKFNKI